MPHAVVEQPALQHREGRHRARILRLAGPSGPLRRARRAAVARRRALAAGDGRRGRPGAGGRLRPGAAGAGAHPALQQARDVLGAGHVRRLAGQRRRRLRQRQRLRLGGRQRDGVKGQGLTERLARGVDVRLQAALPLPLGRGRPAAPRLGAAGAGAVGAHRGELLLEVGVPVVLDVIVGPLREVRRNGRPSAYMYRGWSVTMHGRHGRIDDR